MDKTDKNTIEELLPRYCEGLATEEERLQVEMWMDESEENRRMAKQIHALYLATDTVHIMTKVDTEKALTKVKSRMTGNRQRKTTWWEWAQRAAAVLFIPLLVTLMVQHWGGSEQELAQMMEVKTNPGMMTSLTLPDGTLVFLNSESTLSYPSRFDSDTRNVTLQGEAYFEVSHSDKPFEVHGGGQCVRVLGTSFNVMAYGDESKVQTTLVSGSVRVVLDQSDKTVLLTPGHQAEMDKNSGKITMREVNVENYIGWKDKLFMFDEEDMVTIMNKLARWYDVDIIIETPELKEKVFYGVIRKYENISTILDMLKKTQNIDYLIEGKKIVIKEVR